MRPRVKSGLLWGVVGALSFLVLNNAYVLILGGEFVSPWVLVTVTAAVGVVSALLTYYGEGWWIQRKESL